MRASISAHGSSASIRSKNFSRRVLRFFCAYSRSANVGCSISSPLSTRRFLAMILCQGLVQSVPRLLEVPAQLEISLTQETAV